jgi:peptidoglycan/xylan/chitin deacetylase (PgdA/CDA1 family)
MGKKLSLFIVGLVTIITVSAKDSSWIRINQLGYLPSGIKVAVWCTQENSINTRFFLVDAFTNKKVYANTIGKLFGKYGPFQQTARLDFSAFKQSGKFYIQVGNTRSAVFYINQHVYDGTADFCLQYMRQQRSGFNPFLKDSCHTHDGYTLYASSVGLSDSTHIDATGGWHDASDYLQYSSTSANATYHLLMAFRDYPSVFTDRFAANGLMGGNGRADVLDEAKWGLDWLVKMHPKPNWMFNQLGDDRDHRGMRIPKEDTYYGRGFERPVYFIDGKLQQRGKFLNNTTGTSSTAAKFSAAFSLAATMFEKEKELYQSKSKTAYQYAYQIPGVTQTVSVVSPYIYAEDNWIDDMELANANAFWQNKNERLQKAFSFAVQEPLTPWLGKDTASHYQWYPFINVGHYELAKQLTGFKKDTIIGFYKKGIEAVWQKAKQNAFYRGVPFIWCSNNLTVAFAMQCKWYASLSGNHQYDQLEQANIDWLFGCNPWGTSMVYGLPERGDTPIDPHSAFTHLKNYPINGGLVDGPVYTNIYKNLIGIQLKDADEYAPFQSDLAVYHDDYGDYSTNEPTMDGTASLIYLLASQEASVKTSFVSSNHPVAKHTIDHGAIIKAAPTSTKSIALVFTGDEYGEGLTYIDSILQKEKIKAGFFFTGRMYSNRLFQPSIKKLMNAGHYMGPHSNDHLLYNDWNKRDSLLVSYQQFSQDLNKNLNAMEDIGIDVKNVKLFIPPYEWWNDSVASWTQWRGMQLFSFTPGTFTNADYTWPEMGKQYRSNKFLMDQLQSLIHQPQKLDGSIVLMHVGTDPRRKEKFYHQLPALIDLLQKNQFTIKRIDELLQ